MKKIFRFAIVCAAAGAALLTGCTKDFTSDIDSLKKDLADVKKIAEDAKNAIDAGAVITKVEDVAEGVKVTLSDGKTFTVKNGAAGKDATIWTIGTDGYWYENGTKTDKKAVGTDGKNGTEWTIGSDGYWYKDGTKTTVKATGADGKDGASWSIGADGYWYKDGVKTDYKAKGEDGASGTGTPGATGATGNYWKPDVDNNQWVEYTSEDVATGKTMSPLYKSGTESGVTAIWDDVNGTLEFANVEGKADGKIKIALFAKLKGLALVPDRIYDGLGLITAYEVYGPKVEAGESAATTGAIIKGFPTLNKRAEGAFVTTAPITVAYRPDPQNIDEDDYKWDFINRKVFTVEATKAVEDANDLVSIVDGPKAHGNHFDFIIKLNKSVEAVKLNQNNDIVALRAKVDPEKQPQLTDEIIVSDYAYIEAKAVKDFYIIHKDGEFLYKDGDKNVYYEYDRDDPKYYRWADFVAIGDPTDFNNIPTPTPTKGIDTPAPATTGTNPKAISLPYDGSVDLLDYVDTYSLDKEDLATTLGLTPEYSFQLAGVSADNKFLKGSDPDKVIYLAADVDKTNQNKFIKGITADGTGHVISVNDAFVSLLSPAIGRTPLIYVESFVKDGAGKKVVLAECLIKLEITAEAAPGPEAKGWDVFIWHDVTFPNILPATATYTGKKDSGTASAVHMNANHGTSFTEKDDDLNVTWDEVNPWVLNDEHINMSYEDFGDKYDLSNPKLVLAEGSKEPGATLPDYDKAVLVDPADINTYYSTSGTGLTLTSQSPSNWKQSTNIADLKIDNTFVALNADKDVHYVYVVYPANDNTKNIDVVFKFSFKVEPHVHDFTILKEYHDKFYWILNPDYIQGPQDLLNETKPDADAYYGEGGLDKPAKYVTYGAVRVKGLEDDLRSSFVEHFKEYAKCWKNANEESDYVFKIYNYTNDVVDIVEGGTTTAIDDEAGYATVTISGADLKKIANGTVVSPDVLVRKPAGLSVGKDILVQVTEMCQTVSGTAVKDLPTKDYGKTYVQAYYYVLFEAIKPTVKFNEVKLGDFKDQNDYALVSEIVAGVYESDAADAIALFEWQPEVKDETGAVVTAAGWKLGPSAATYGITDATKISFKISTLIYGLNEKDTEDSFKGRLSTFEAGDAIEPWPLPLGSVAEGGINWRNDGTNLEKDKVAGFVIEVLYDGESLTKGTGEVTVMKTNSKPHPNHNEDGTIWE